MGCHVLHDSWVLRIHNLYLINQTVQDSYSENISQGCPVQALGNLVNKKFIT